VNFKVFGTQIYISFLFAAVITVMLCFDKTGMLLPTLFAVFMHECGHLFMMWILRCAPKEIRLIPASVQITNSFSGGYKNDVLIALSGPIVNFLLFGVCYFNFLRYENEFVGYFALVNLVIGFFNLLPVKGLDGGTALFSLLCKFCDINKATVMVRILSLFVATVVLITAVMLILKGNPNLSLFIMGVYLVVMSVMKM
jgi:Zn-dependent protease